MRIDITPKRVGFAIAIAALIYADSKANNLAITQCLLKNMATPEQKATPKRSLWARIFRKGEKR